MQHHQAHAVQHALLYAVDDLVAYLAVRPWPHQISTSVYEHIRSGRAPARPGSPCDLEPGLAQRRRDRLVDAFGIDPADLLCSRSWRYSFQTVTRGDRFMAPPPQHIGHAHRNAAADAPSGSQRTSPRGCAGYRCAVLAPSGGLPSMDPACESVKVPL